MKSIPGLVRRLKASKKRLGKERDIMASIIEDYKDLLESTEETCDSLDDAIDSLSQHT